MENTLINDYLLSLRNEGYNFYSKEEILATYETMIYDMEKSGYDGIIAEFENDMDFWNVVNCLKNIIVNNRIITIGAKEFLDKFQVIDNRLINISSPVNNPPDLPWWWYRVLKKGSKVYAEDVKLTYGIYIEIVE